MADFEEVRRIAMSLPEAEERLSRGRLQWLVGGKLFVWERPLRPKEVEQLGGEAPGGPILGVRVEHLLAKEAMLADEPGVFFTTPHFEGHPSVLVRLEEIGAKDLEEVVTEAWFARAPPKLARSFER
jgi:hypothetical protein